MWIELESAAGKIGTCRSDDLENCASGPTILHDICCSIMNRDIDIYEHGDAIL